MSDSFLLVLMVVLGVAAIWRSRYLKRNPQQRNASSRRTDGLSHKNLMNGFWWHTPPLLPLAAGQGWNTEVRGESYRQDALLRIVGGKGRYGSNWNSVAELRMPNDIPDHPNAVSVHISGDLVGFIPSEQSEQIRRELMVLPGIEQGVTCKATIVGGWDSTADGGDTGSFGVRLSLSRPLKVRKI